MSYEVINTKFKTLFVNEFKSQHLHLLSCALCLHEIGQQHAAGLAYLQSLQTSYDSYNK